MRCVFNSPRPSQRTRPKRKAFPNEIPFVSFLPLTLPTSSSRTSDGTRNLFSLPPRIAVPTPARLSSAGDPRGEACPAPHSNTRSQPNCWVRAQFAAPASQAGQILVPCPGPPMEMRTPPCSRLQPATQLRHTKPHTHICGRGGVRANSPGTREGRGRRGRVGGTGWDPAAQVRARRRPGRSLTR